MATSSSTSPRRRGGLRGLARSGKGLAVSLLGEDRFLTARAGAQIWLDRRRGKQLLMAHTMGKVGSTTITASLKARRIRQTMAMYQPHFVSEEGMAFAERLSSEGVGGWARLTRKERRGFLRNHLLNRELSRMRAAGERVKVITMVRDPVATNLSGLFHNYIWWPADVKALCAERSAGCLDALRQYFLARYPHDVPETWFDMEVRTLYGVDVYAEPFDRERGYHIYRSDFADVLLLKLEKLNECASVALRDFLGLEDFQLVESNTAEDKSYADLYKSFRREVALPESYLDEVYGTRFSRHFYTPVEIDAFRRKWLAPAGAARPAPAMS